MGKDALRHEVTCEYLNMKITDHLKIYT